MTAAELIEELKRFDPEAEVRIPDGVDDYYQDPLYTGIMCVDFHAADLNNPACIRLEGI